MHKSKIAVALGAVVALVAAPLLTSTAASAASGANSGSQRAVVSSAHAAPNGIDAVKKQYAKPNKKYKKGTGLAQLPPDGTIGVTKVPLKGKGCKGMTATLSVPSESRQVGVDWATWGIPPFTENATPQILYVPGVTSVDITFSKPTNKAGAEIEPNPFEIHDYQVTYDGGSAISVTADGNGGARLGGAKLSANITKMTITDVTTAFPPADFAIAQLRAAC